MKQAQAIEIIECGIIVHSQDGSTRAYSICSMCGDMKEVEENEDDGSCIGWGDYPESICEACFVVLVSV